MKIVILADCDIYRFLAPNSRGIPKHPGDSIRHLLKYLNQLSSVSLITMDSEFDKDYLFNEDGVKYFFLKPTSKWIKYITFLWSNAHKVHNLLRIINPDIIYSVGLNRLAYFALTSNYPTVVCNTGFNRDHFITGNHKMNIYWATSFIYEKLVLRRMKFVQAVSPYVAEEPINYNKIKRLYVVEPPINELYFRDYDLSWESFILYVGSIIERKNLIDLLMAIKPLRHIRLKVISMTDAGEYYNRVLRFIDDNGMKGRVDFLGYRDPRGIIEELQKCLALVLPSKWESNGMVYAEAMAVGKPVIGTNVAAIPFTIKDGVTGFVIALGNVSALTQKIAFLSQNKESAQLMGQAGRSEALTRWHPEKIAIQMKEIFNDVLGSLN